MTAGRAAKERMIKHRNARSNPGLTPDISMGLVGALLFGRFGIEDVVHYGDDGIGLLHQRNVCRVR